MKKEWAKWTAAVSILLLSAGAVAAADNTAAPVLQTQKERESYALGVDMEQNYKQLGVDLDPDLVARGMRDASGGGKLLMNDNEVANVMITFRGEMVARTGAKRTFTAAENKKAGEEFLAANKKKEGVVTLPDGIQYKILKAGKGRIPVESDTVVCQYRGTTIKGAEFENTYLTKQPAVFALSDARVIVGLREVLRLMPAGSRWQVFIPSRLAFLTHGAPPTVGPNEVVIYDLELISVK